MITETFDNATEEILKPSSLVKKIEGFPETVIVVFSTGMIEAFQKKNKSEVVCTVKSGIDVMVYKTAYKGKEIGYYLTWIGGPATVGILEEIIVMGAKKILLFGACGSLEQGITDGHIIVPTHAYRDEGTSYHYASGRSGEFVEVKTAKRLSKILNELEIPVIEGKTWTTDAIFRETRRNMELRKKAGCLTVEMECASVMAMAKFRNVEVYQFLFTADNLDCSEWESRILSNMPQDLNERYTQIALEVASRL